MSKTIYKYRINRFHAQQKIDMPAGATILTLQLQGSLPTIWALINTEAPNITRNFQIVGTGHDVPNCGRYVGTWQEDDYVWHLFETTGLED